MRLTCAKPGAAPQVEPAARLLRGLALGHSVSMDRPAGTTEDSGELLLRRVFMPAPSGDLLELGSEVAVARLGYELGCELPETLPAAYIPGAAAAVAAGLAAGGGAGASAIPAACAGMVAVVSRVVDGDAVVIGEGDTAEKVRLACVGTPETVNPQKPVEFFGKQASAFTTSLMLGQTVCLERDPEQGDRDQYGRLVRCARLADGRDVSAEIIGRGYGFAYSGMPCARKKDYAELERQARGHFQGLWNPNAQQVAESSMRPAGAYVDLGTGSTSPAAGSTSSARGGVVPLYKGTGSGAFSEVGSGSAGTSHAAGSTGASGRKPGTDVHVRAYTRDDGTQVKAHTRARPGEADDQ